jgi:sulfur-carrier protein
MPPWRGSAPRRSSAVARLVFTAHLGGVAPRDPLELPGATIGEVLAQAFAAHRGLAHYVLDDQERLRKHVVIFADGRRLDPAGALAAAVSETSEIYVMQALSGG